MSESKRLHYRAVDGTAKGVVTLPKDMNEPVDLLAEDIAIKSEWWIKTTHYINADSYDLMKGGDCYGTFPERESLRGFAQLLKDDLESGREIAQVAKDSYKEIIRVIEAEEV